MPRSFDFWRRSRSRMPRRAGLAESSTSPEGSIAARTRAISLRNDAAPAPVAAAGEEEAKIEGQAIARAGGGWLGLKVEGGTFRLRFYDANKKPIAPDVARAVLRWKSNRRIAREVAVLTLGGEPNLMTSEKSVPPPYSFRLTLVLLRTGSGESEADEAGEAMLSAVRWFGWLPFAALFLWTRELRIARTVRG